MSFNNLHSKGQVPFAWENKPGIRKSNPKDEKKDDFTSGGGAVKLPPPPVQVEGVGRGVVASDLQNIPLPPCAFQGVISRNGSKREFYKEQDDPFLVAYKKCTKSSGSNLRSRSVKRMNSMNILSCKNSCSVRDDSIVRISQLPLQKPE